MSKSASSKTVNVFMTLDPLVIEGYFNRNDPSPIYKRQLSHQFDQYIMSSVGSAKRFDAIFYKIKCNNDIDKQFADPLMLAIRRHFSEKRTEEVKSFNRFKKRNWAVLGFSLVLVILFQLLLPMLISDDSPISDTVSHLVDVFAWVILWHPIDELLFNWNPHLKRIGLYNKLATAELILLENEKKSVVNDSLRFVAA